MEDEYGIADLRQMIAGRTSFPAMNHHQQSELVQFNRSFPGATGVMPARLGHEHYAEMLMLGGGGMHHHQVGVLGVVDHHNQNLCGSGSGGGGMMEFCSAANDDSTATTNSTTSNMTTINPNNTSGVCVLEMMEGNNVNGGVVNNGVAGGDNGGGNSRWPRQETLTLLEIRSSLDNKFKEANQKGPLWDEVARIMGAEHGYQRSGKKCREKFENLYKYYKKTKEGKSGRQDGKNYRFFRQLEALYGETTNINHQNTNFDGHEAAAGLSFQFMNNNSSASTHSHQTKFSDQSLSLSNSSDFDTSSSEDNNDEEDLTTFAFMDENGKNKNKIVKDLKRGSRKNWKAKIRDFVDARMKKLMETQEAWLDKVLKTLEHKEQERLTREEEWRRQETARLDQEHKFWAKERARFEARDAVIMEAVQRMVGNEVKVSSSPDQEVLITTRFHEATENQSHNRTQAAFKKISHNRWLEDEISNLIHLRTGMESRFRQCVGYSEKSLWEDISSKMVSLGYDRSAEMCEEKWLTVCSKYTTKTDIIGSNSTYKEYCTRNAVPLFHHFNSTRNHDHLGGGAFPEQGPETMGVVPSPPSNSAAGMTAAPVQDSCFRFMMTQNDQGDNLWQNYGVKLNSEGGGNQTNRFISPLEEI
ncbi:hypothetical protein MKW94_022510 [Papaver nudicaule]|uniref:Myb-like domain-containing protein n=1 Tax=Papaver nudicaule TaxID=74823 RepID=A0AA41V3G7_PAPNU|nr:hypothetical protein [Papaver nudicaule]